MSRITKWKLEQTKVKVVFRLQFHVTHIPHAGWDKLFVTFLPADSRKATAKTSKANVRNGTCKWADPIYETTRLLQDTTTKQYDEKLYKLVVATVSSRSSVLGEVTINLAHYADALKPSAVALPLQGCDFGSILHITVQLLTSKVGFREFEQQRELRESGLQATSDAFIVRKLSSSEDTINDQLEKANSRVILKEELPPIEENCADSFLGFDGSSNTSESLYAEKRDTSSTHETDSLKYTLSGHLVGLSLSQSPHPEKGNPSIPHLLPQRSNGWSHGFGSDFSTDNNLINGYEENSRLKGSLEAAVSSIIELKLELGTLQSNADEIGIEAQNISQLLATEIASGERLAKEVSALRSECSEFKNDIMQLRNSKLSNVVIINETKEKSQDQCSEELQHMWLKVLLEMEDKIKELQNKACYSHERDFKSFNSDLEALIGVLQDLKEGAVQAAPAMNLTSSKDNGEAKLPALVSQQYDSTYQHNAMKKKIFEHQRELDELKTEREGLLRKMGEMECYSEALIRELEESQKQMNGELQNLRNEHSACLYTLSATKSEMDKIKKDTSKKVIRISEEKCNLESLNEDLERRAVTAEAALKRMQLNYSISVNQLQKDLRLLSSQVVSMYETNENLIQQAFSNSSLSCSLGCEEKVQNWKLEGNKFQALDLFQHSNQNGWSKKHCVNGHIFSEDMKRSILLLKGLCQKVEDEIFEVHLVNIYLDVFSMALQETLLEATSDYKLMKDLVDELKQQLQLSNESKELLRQNLQMAVDEVQCLKEYKDACDAKFNDVAFQNQFLEDNFQNMKNQNYLLSQKVTEGETLTTELVSYQRKFEACIEEKLKLERLLQKERLENDFRQNNTCSMQKEMKCIQIELNELAFVKENLQKTLNFVHDKMWSLLASYDKQNKGSSLWSQSILEDIESRDLIGMLLKLEQLQHRSHEKILQLVEEKQVLVQERDTAQVSLQASESEKILMREKFEHEVQSIMHKQDGSSVLVQRLQSKVEAIAKRCKISSEAEDDYAQKHREILSDFDHMEGELNQLTFKNKDLAQEIMAIEKVNEELGSCKLVIASMSMEKQTLMMTIKEKTEESSMLARDHRNLKSSFQSLHYEFLDERSCRSRLEGTVQDLTARLTEKHREELQFNQQQAELVDLKQLVSNLEMENSRIKYNLLNFDECTRTAREECSSISFFDTKLSEMHEDSITMDVVLTFMKTHYKTVIQELNQKLCSSDMCLAELQKRFVDVQNKLDCCFASEAYSVKENARLMESLNSLKSDFDASVAENKALMDTNRVMKTQLEEYKERVKRVESSFYIDTKNAHEVEKLEHMLRKSEEVINVMTLSKEELEVQCLVFKAKLDELQPQIALLEGNKCELTELQDKYSELTHRFSEQVLKTKEFKNLSIHMKELKDKADAECHKAREKREPEGPLLARQDSLRIAIIKEKYETKLLELKRQLSISNRHREEMLLKLQDVIEEVDNRKKSEATNLKINEELGMRILELESQLHSALSEKHEVLRACDLMNAEKECSLISLQCCKEEKQKLEASLQNCNEEKSRIAAELTSVKDFLESSISAVNNQMGCIGRWQAAESKSYELVSSMIHPEKPISDSPTNGKFDKSKLSGESIDDPLNAFSDQDISKHFEEVDTAGFNKTNKPDDSNVGIQEARVYRTINQSSNQEDVLHDDTKSFALVVENFKARSLNSSMDHLMSELEKMKQDNLLLPQEDQHHDPIFHGLQRELVQLHKVNEELGSIFPIFNEFSSSGNALERVLALEIELAEALKAKKKPSIHFQSSFLKQHSDEEAVFQSFRDINELIKDMLEFKGKYAAVDTELKEMHDRYSQLKLQFAVVEGERQKLMMTLKNVRGSNKLSYLNCLSTVAVMDNVS